MKARPKPLGLLRKVPLLPNGASALNISDLCICQFPSNPSFHEAIGLSVTTCQLYPNQLNCIKSFQLILKCFQSIHILFSLIHLASANVDQYSAERQLLQLFIYLLPFIVQQKITLFFSFTLSLISSAVTYSHLEDIAGH